MTPNLPTELQPLATLIATVHRLEARVEELERARPVPAVVRFRDFPEWYRIATGSPVPPVTRSQLGSWRSRPEHFRVDWIREIGGKPWVDVERFVAWTLRESNLVRIGATKASEESEPSPGPRKTRGNRTRVGAAGRVEIARRRKAGEAPESIAEKVGVSVGYVKSLTRGLGVDINHPSLEERRRKLGAEVKG